MRQTQIHVALCCPIFDFFTNSAESAVQNCVPPHIVFYVTLLRIPTRLLFGCFRPCTPVVVLASCPNGSVAETERHGGTER